MSAAGADTSLDAIYESMNQRNTPSVAEPIVNPDLSQGFCYAAYALGDWCLIPAWGRLRSRLLDILGDSDCACLYTPRPGRNEGRLHQTLLQFESFDVAPTLASDEIKQTQSIVAKVLEGLAEGVRIQYRGIVWTRTGLALAGYPTDPDDYPAIMKLRAHIRKALEAKGLPFSAPYHNDILHATLLRWTRPPSTVLVAKLQEEIVRWSECDFGSLQIREWLVGKATWRMLDNERSDMYKISVYTFIAHRGNLDGPCPQTENHPVSLRQCIDTGFAVECDVWYRGGRLWLGHDAPEYATSLQDLLHRRRLVHAKDGATLAYLLQQIGQQGLDIEVFYHTTEDYALTNKGRVIVYPGQPILEGSICMMPEKAAYAQDDKRGAAAICSDWLSVEELFQG